MLMLILIPIAIFWLLVAVVVLAACRAAAAGDGRELQSPRRARTWGTMRKRILTSPPGDQLATYR